MRGMICLSDIGLARWRRIEREALKYNSMTRGLRVRLALGTIVSFEAQVTSFTKEELEWFRGPIKEDVQ